MGNSNNLHPEEKKQSGKGKLFRSALSVFLAVTMAASAVVPTLAAEKPDINLPASRIENVPEGNLVYVGTAAATVQEEDQIYSVPLYREGDLSKEASVEIHSIDMTALYGKDYELVMPDVETTGSKETILEHYSKISPEESAEALPEENPEEEPVPPADVKEEAPETSDAAPASQKDDGEKTLAELKEEQTGLPTRETTQADRSASEQQAYEMLESLVPDTMAGLDYSASVKVTFAPGENEKTLRFRILDDSDSEGAEGFSLLLVNPVEMEVYEATSLSVTIEDNEDPIHSKVSFTCEKYRSEDGVATLTIKRTDAEYSVVDMVIRSSQNTAQAGVNYNEVNETIAFAPYETEKEFEIPVAGQGDFDVILTDLKACEPGDYDRATIVIDEMDAEQVIDPYYASGDKSFNIEIGGKTYSVVYNMGDQKGKIMDNGYEPALQVGEYYFSSDSSHGGFFKYDNGQYTGSKPWGCGTRESAYHYDSGDNMSRNYGSLRYYHTTTWKNGTTYAYSTSSIPVGQYQYLAPDWESTSSFGGGQKFEFRFSGSQWSKNIYANGQFGRTQNNAKIIFGRTGKNGEDNTSDANGTFRVTAIDDQGNRTPKSYLKFYGIAAMFKQYDIAMTEPSKLEFLTPTGKTDPVEPVQTKIICGAQNPYQHELRTVFVSTDLSKCQVVFSTSNTHVNGHDGKFGAIQGYTITVGIGDKSVKLNYPQDFVNFLNSRRNRTSGCVDYSSASIDKRISVIHKNLDTIQMDDYFAAWIESNQKGTLSGDIGGYKQKLIFKPLFHHNDVQVTVLPSIGGRGSFNASNLAAGKTVTFHAGDKLNLSAQVENSDSWHIAGYQVSTDGGKNFNTITDTDSLFLESFHNYMIRPVVAENTNRIEIRFADETARKVLQVQETMTADQLAKEPSLKGATILCLNPKASSVTDKMSPVVGKDYAVRIKVVGKPSEKGYVYRPVITDNLTGKVYNTQVYYTNARARMADNLLTLSVEKVKESELRKFTINGSVVSSIPPIRSDGQELKNLPVSGKTVVMASGQQDKEGNILTASSLLSDGDYTFMDVLAKDGDRVTVLVSDGLNNGQVVEIELSGTEESDQYVANAGMCKLTYPSDMPRVTDILYSYDKVQNNQSNDNTYNSVNIYDDNFNITAYADLKGHEIEKAIFTVYTTTGQTFDYPAYPDEHNPGKFHAVIPKMVDNLNNGDRIKVRLIDKEKASLETGSGSSQLNIEYLDVDTGIVFYTENVLKVPQHYEVSQAPQVDIPLVGAAKGQASSGPLAFSRTNWPGNTGYSIDINITGSYSNKGAGTKQKKDSLDKFSGLVKENRKALSTSKQAKNTADDIMLRMEEMDSHADDLEFDYDEIRDQLATELEENQKLHEEQATKYDNTKKTIEGFGDEPLMSVNGNIMVQLDFVYSPVSGEYVFSYFGITIGGTFSFNKTFYQVVYGIPCFLNLNGAVQATMIFDGASKEGVAAFTAGEFDTYAGNIADLLPDDGLNSTLNLMGKLTTSVGVGLANILSARGYVSLQIQFNIKLSEKDIHKSGALLNAAGGIAFDVLIGTIDIQIATGTLGFGSMAGKTSFNFFGGLMGGDRAKANAIGYTDGECKILSQDENGQTMVYRDLNVGTGDLSSFGQEDRPTFYGKPVAVSKTILLENAAERTKPHIIPLGEGKKMITFLGNRNDFKNTLALYYSVFDGTSWSDPRIVSDDATLDTAPAVLRVDDKIVFAWSDASREYTSADNTKTKLQALGISAIVYDIATDTMSEEKTLVADKFLNQAPQLCRSGDKIYCTYLKRDLDKVTKEDELLDLSGLYSTMAWVEYDMKTGVKQEERYATIRHPSLVDPLTLDYQAEIVEVEGDSYMIITYTVDEDKDLNSGGDRTLWMEIVDIATQKAYYPMQLTSDYDTSGAPRLTKLNNTLYLTYLKNGAMFNILDVNRMLKDLFYPSDADSVDGFEGFDPSQIYKNASCDDSKWYKKTAEELGISEETYEGTFYANICKGDFGAAEANFRNDELAGSSVSNYSLETNGKEIYVFYTDVSSVDSGVYNTGRELFGVRYIPEGEEGQSAGFGKPSQLTDYNKVIDELDLYMTEDNEICAVSNFYSQMVGDDDKIHFGPNALVEVDAVPVASFAVDGDRIFFPSRLVGGDTAELHLSVTNTGLLTANGYDIRVTQEKNGIETEIYNETMDVVLDTDQSHEHILTWNVPEDISDTVLNVYIKENNTVSGEVKILSQKVPYASHIYFENTELTLDGTQLIAKTTVANDGNKDSAALSGTIRTKDAEGNIIRDITKFNIPELASGESKEYTFKLSPSVKDFSMLGILDLEFVANDGDKEIATDTEQFASSAPILAEINNGTERITVESGKTASLTVAAAPWDAVAGEAQFYSEDPDIAKVSGDGTVTALKSGKAVIRAYYPDSGITDDITVDVTSEKVKFEDVTADAFYYDSVSWAIDHNITKGVSETKFAPYDDCTRAQMITFLWRAAGSPAPASDKNTFTDVHPDDYFYNAVLWAAENGIAQGTLKSKFEPFERCTRAQAVTFLWRAKNKPAATGTVTFTDVPEQAYYYDAVRWAVSNQITNGVETGKFKPNDFCNRGHAVTFLHRIYGK